MRPYSYGAQETVFTKIAEKEIIDIDHPIGHIIYLKMYVDHIHKWMYIVYHQ